MPVVNPGIRRFLGSAIQRLFNSASFYAPLTHSLVPERGTGSPTYTNTTANRTFRDWEGVLRYVPAGCARFEGARMVRNLLTFTEDFSNAAWLKSFAGAGSAPVVTADQEANPIAGTSIAFADKVVFAAPGAGDLSMLQQSFTGATGNAYLGFFYVKAFAAGDVGKVILFRHAAGGSYTQVTLTAAYQRVSVKEIGTGTVAFDVGLRPTFSSSSGTVSIYLTATQLEDVTGQADQTASEYVSVGVLSAPYHGAGVDGVEFFNTDRDGAVIPAATNTGYLAEGARTNLCLQSNAFTTTWTANGTPAATQNVIGPDGGTTGWTLTDNNAASIEGVSQTIALPAATYTYSVFVKKTTGAQSSYPGITTDNGVSRIAACTVDTTNGVATVWTAYTGLTVQTSSATCVSHNENYWRVSLTFLATAENWTHYLIVAATTNATQSTGSFDQTVQGSAVFYGVQIELGSSASTYIPTTTTALTRAADVLTYPVAGNLPASNGTMYAEILSNAASTAAAEVMSNYDALGRSFYPLANRQGFLTIYDSGGPHISSLALTMPQSSVAKVGSTWVGTAGTCALNGSVANVTLTDDTQTLSTSFAVGNTVNGIGGFNGTIRNVRIWNRQLSASEMQAITA